MDAFHQLDKFHKTRLGWLGFGLVELVLALVCANFAIGNGSLWLCVLALILLVGFFQNSVRVVVCKK